MTEDEMVGWHHWLKGHKFEQAWGDDEGQGSLACCSPRGCKESDMTQWPNNIRIILEFFEEYKCPGIVFLFLFCQSSRCDSNEEPCLKRLDYMMIFYLYLVCFTFSILYSGLPFHLVCFPIFPSLFFSVFLSQAFFKFSRNVYVYIQTDIYIVRVCVTQSCPTLCNPMDYSPPGSSVHRILQARILVWFAIPFSKGSSQARDRTQVSCIQANSLLSEPPGNII